MWPKMQHARRDAAARFYTVCDWSDDWECEKEMRLTQQKGATMRNRS